MTGESADFFYIDTSLLPVTAQLNWEQGVFTVRAEAMAIHCGFPGWKKDGITQTLERTFNRLIAEGKSFDQAMEMVDTLIKRGIVP